MKFWAAVSIGLVMWLEATANAYVSATLPNGLHVLVKPDHRVPLATVQVWYKVGSKDEVDGTTGIAHFLEHLMFMGTKTYPGGQFSSRIAALGGTENAQTSRDYTMYYETVPNTAVDQVLAYEADRMRGLQLEQARVDREQHVVAEERRMRLEDAPTSLAFEQSMAMLFVRGPYHHMPIGWMSDIQHYTMQDAQAWYDRWYHPNNAIVVVSGDVKPKQVIEQVRRHFSTLKATPLPTAKPKPNPPLQGQHVFTMHDPKVKARHYTYLYRVPSLRMLQAHPEDAYALNVLVAILAAGQSSMLEHALRFDQTLVSSVSVSYDFMSFYDGVFGISMTLLPKTDAHQAVSVLQDVLQRAQRQPVSAKVLARAKAQFIAGHIYAQDGLTAVASQMGYYAINGLTQQQRLDFIPGIQRVTAKQVMAVAKRYLQPQKRVLTEVLPVQKVHQSKEVR
jgi:zinc protease